jgi:HSP20 family protein
LSWWEDFPDWFRMRRRRSPFFGFGGDIFEEMNRLFEDMFREIWEQVPRDLIRERKLPDGSTVREAGPFVYGYSVTMGPDGKPVVREFGNVRPKAGAFPGRAALEVKEEREPLVDTIVEDDTVRVVAEIPGVEKEDINLQCTEDSLVISVDSEKRKYYKELDLPAAVDPNSSKASYKNGVLEVTFKKKAAKPKGKEIKID